MTMKPLSELKRQNPTLTTSQNIQHVYGCRGSFMHLIPGFALLRAGNANVCPYCGAAVADMTHSPVGKAYLEQAGFDLGAQQ